MPRQPTTESSSEAFDVLNHITSEASAYEQLIRNITAISNKIKRMAKDVLSKKEKIRNIGTSSAYQKFKYITKSKNSYNKWALQDAYENIEKKKNLTEKLNLQINELDRLLEQRDRRITDLQNLPKRRVRELSEDALLTPDEQILNHPSPATVWKDDDYTP